MIEDCTLLINTYDGGEDIWEGFFKALSIQWPEVEMNIIMNTESKRYEFPGFDIKTLGLYEYGVKVEWGKRMIDTLKKIDTEYVLCMLEDFWLEDKVDNERFIKCLDNIRSNKDVACFYFQPVLDENNINDERFEGFVRRPQKGNYRFNCQIALWRKEKLLHFIRAHESAWAWELYGSIRSQRYKDGIYTAKNGDRLIFPYKKDNGAMIRRGMWVKANVIPLQERYELDIDYSKRGFIEDYLNSNTLIERRCIKDRIKNRISLFRSLL